MSSCGIEIIDCVQVSTTSSPHCPAGNKWAEAAEFKIKNMNAVSITPTTFALQLDYAP